MKASGVLVGVRALVWLGVFAVCLSALSACMPQAVQQPPPVASYSLVVTQDGMAYSVRGLRLPGTRQELRIKEGGTMTWVPLEQLTQVRFSGPVHENYRQARLTLTGGGQLHGEVYVNFLIEGATDLGYWNMPLSKVESLALAFD